MAPSIDQPRQSVSHDWRRRSLVRVRRPAWAVHAPEAERVHDAQTPPTDAAPKPHTTHNDIAW